MNNRLGAYQRALKKNWNNKRKNPNQLMTQINPAKINKLI